MPGDAGPITRRGFTSGSTTAKAAAPIQAELCRSRNKESIEAGHFLNIGPSGRANKSNEKIKHS